VCWNSAICVVLSRLPCFFGCRGKMFSTTWKDFTRSIVETWTGATRLAESRHEREEREGRKREDPLSLSLSFYIISLSFSILSISPRKQEPSHKGHSQPTRDLQDKSWPPAVSLLSVPVSAVFPQVPQVPKSSSPASPPSVFKSPGGGGVDRTQ
jgi:hypothetical protein